MNKYSDKSMERINECHPDLQRLFKAVLPYFDHSITCGHRGEEEQNKAYDNGYSKLKYPLSKHNKIPSFAVDAYPYPIDWQDTERMCVFAGYVLLMAKQKAISIRWGGDFNMDGRTIDEKFKDYGHFELLEKKRGR